MEPEKIQEHTGKEREQENNSKEKNKDSSSTNGEVRVGGCDLENLSVMLRRSDRQGKR